MNRRALLLALPALAMTGCAGWTPVVDHVTAPADPLEAGAVAAADKLRDQLATRNLLTDDPVLVLTFQELRSLADPRGFGKVCAERVASRMVELGLKVVDLRYTGAISITERNGETVLSREASKLAASHRAKVVVTGTYVVIGAEARVSLRAVAAADGIVLASADFRLPAEYVRNLLG
jgi:TolB-like protein